MLFNNDSFFGFSKPSTANEQSSEDYSGFQSHFKAWIRTVALVVVLVFTPEQISWAFNYNPAVLWGQQKVDAYVGIKAAATIAESIKDLLTQIQGKEKARVKLELPNAGVSGATNNRGLLVTTTAQFTQDDVYSFESWLKQTSIQHLNCGVYALRDLLVQNQVGISLEEISVLTLSVDILGKIIKAGDPRLKTSLYALDSIASAYGLNFKAVKIANQDIDHIDTPFIANLDPEHFVLVTQVNNDTIAFNDIGISKVFFKDEFLKKFTGYVLAPNTESLKGAEVVSSEKKAFIWGSQWASPYEETIKSQSFDSDAFWTSLIIDIIV
ncbi:MAG: cysteine peptidase family C39 domain-containing protein, partial [Candidatus Omnitrophota bacterium]